MEERPALPVTAGRATEDEGRAVHTVTSTASRMRVARLIKQEEGVAQLP